ncbi:MAG: LysE family transporter [Peptostreptococcaceae bacterium]|nr:LysE family transporter [Peptostreptococcaceae bacterium]MDY5738857.1 LysE family transporter [Anaerovoracaceae bacterium]
MQYLINGLVVGFAYVMPIGVQNLFMINTALTQSKKRSYATAFIIMFFDITLAVACFFGIGAIMSASKWLEIVVLGIGSLIVMWIGFSIFKSKDTLDRSTNVDMPLLKVIGTACVVTWFNPQAIIDGSMMLGAFKVSIPGNMGLLFIVGVCLASAIWWLLLATVVRLFSNKINDKTLRVINIICGGIIFFYGIKLLISFVHLVQGL